MRGDKLPFFSSLFDYLKHELKGTRFLVDCQDCVVYCDDLGFESMIMTINFLPHESPRRLLPKNWFMVYGELKI